MWREYIEQRKAQRAKEDEDLRKLKERQAKRRAAREMQEKAMMEYKRKAEEARSRGNADICIGSMFLFLRCSLGIDFETIKSPRAVVGWQPSLDAVARI